MCTISLDALTLINGLLSNNFCCSFLALIPAATLDETLGTRSFTRLLKRKKAKLLEVKRSRNKTLLCCVNFLQ